MLRARGECIDRSAGPRLIPRGGDVPGNLAAANQGTQDLLVVRQKNTTVVASPVPLDGPLLYEFHLAHR